MSFELVFTSVPKGLKPGSRGFASVACTRGMPANYVELCESLSGYVHVFGPHDVRYIDNPVATSHLIASTGGRTFSLLSRVASCGLDYTGRTNKFAHHIMLSPEERVATCGPAVALNQPGLFLTEWSGEPAFLPPGRASVHDRPIFDVRAHAWQAAIGDAGFAGLLAQSFIDYPERPSFVIYEPGMDIQPLFAEAQALLPENRRWDLTFTTYFMALPVGMKCIWRGCLPDSDGLVLARRTPQAMVVDLTKSRITVGAQVITARDLDENLPLVWTARHGWPAATPKANDAGVAAAGQIKVATQTPRTVSRTDLPPVHMLSTIHVGEDRNRDGRKKKRLVAFVFSLFVVLMMAGAGAFYYLHMRLEDPAKKPGKTAPIAPDIPSEPAITNPAPAAVNEPPPLQSPRDPDFPTNTAPGDEDAPILPEATNQHPGFSAVRVSTPIIVDYSIEDSKGVPEGKIPGRIKRIHGVIESSQDNLLSAKSPDGKAEVYSYLHQDAPIKINWYKGGRIEIDPVNSPIVAFESSNSYLYVRESYTNGHASLDAHARKVLLYFTNSTYLAILGSLARSGLQHSFELDGQPSTGEVFFVHDQAYQIEVPAPDELLNQLEKGNAHKIISNQAIEFKSDLAVAVSNKCRDEATGNINFDDFKEAVLEDWFSRFKHDTIPDEIRTNALNAVTNDTRADHSAFSLQLYDSFTRAIGDYFGRKESGMFVVEVFSVDGTNRVSLLKIKGRYE